MTLRQRFQRISRLHRLAKHCFEQAKVCPQLEGELIDQGVESKKQANDLAESLPIVQIGEGYKVES